MRLSLLLALLALASCTSGLDACTGLKLKARDGSIVTGRTFEFGVEVVTVAVVIPRGFEFVGTAPNGPGLKYKAKYGVVGAMAADNLAVIDGLNQFDIPVGIAKDKENGHIYSDTTLATTVKDPQALKYYFRTYDNQTIHMIDLNQFDLHATGVKKMAMNTSSTLIVDVSILLY